MPRQPIDPEAWASGETATRATADAFYAELARKRSGPDPRDERIAALEAALRALVGGEQPVVEDDGEYFCWFCDKKAPGRMRPLTHEPGCPWVTARALLGEEKD